MTLRCLMLAAAVLVAAACEDLPTAATPVAGPTPPVAAPPLPTTVPGVLSLSMPIDAADVVNGAFGLAPYGYHAADHASDGHPGWDIEYRLGGRVRAGAAGRITHVMPDAATPGRTTVQIEHVVGTHFYRTVYTNLASVESGVVVDETVVAGQPLGIAGTISATVGAASVTYAMTHFQLDDFEYYRDVPNPNAVSPEPFLNAPAMQLFTRIWETAVYGPELVEPFATNPRDLRFPASRTWTRAGGAGPAGIRFTRRTPRGADYEYELLAESGTVIETGSVALNLAARPYPAITLTSPTAIRLGIYDLISNEMHLTLANPGEPRPVTLDPTQIYRTTR